ncbi:WD40-repeat-containing domain protein [Xylariales sp. PMI_506]|nr:WD40-repeat-containing domain protein [Xylariales sp. PMI_506]
MRESSTPLPDRFKTTKQSHELSTSERLHRNCQALPDAFCFRPLRSGPRRAIPQRPPRPDHGGRRSGNRRNREVSAGAVWSIGGTAPGGASVDGGRGHYLGSGTNAPLYTASFSKARPKSDEEQEKHEGRLAVALELDRVQRMLDYGVHSTFPRYQGRKKRSILATSTSTKTTWSGTEWLNQNHPMERPKEVRMLPTAPFKVLDAPGLRDDFYCSVMAYSSTCNTVVVALGNLLYSWSETTGVSLLNGGVKDGSWLTSVGFSSNEGKKSILAFGRSNGTISLLSLFDSMLPRFEAQHHHPVACLSWCPIPTTRSSVNPFNPGETIKAEDLLVGEETGDVYYYSEVARHNWPGALTLLARIKVHSQQICGLAWSNDGELFATGGNDNLCCLLFHSMNSMDLQKIVPQSGWQLTFEDEHPFSATDHSAEARISSRLLQLPPPGLLRTLLPSSALQKWTHLAAVKAIAFCPWRPHLVATGGGSNDKMIRFFHTTTGATLATISVNAQITSLTWSTVRREIAATFGYAQPDHAVRIAVFSWPECQMVGSIKWDGDHRALYAISYPGGEREGCLIVASSDESVKFHEVWGTGRGKATIGTGPGVLGGSDIIEMVEGIDKEGDIIR